jgi:replicative DNA helicase
LAVLLISRSSSIIPRPACTVKEFARRRAWRDVAEAIAKVAYDKDSSLELEASGIVDRLLNAVRSEGAATHISYYTAQVLDEVATRRKNPADVWGIPTGFSDFDYITGGLQLSEILYISGEPGVGKSIMADQMGFQMAEAGYPGAIYSLEMPGKQVVRRRFSFQSKVQMRAIKTGRLDDEQYESLLETASAHDSLPLYMSDSVMWTTASLRADLARLKTQYGIQWFVLDYAYLLQDGRNMSENDRTGLVSAYLKAICRSLNIAGIVIHSLNKSGMGGDGSVPTGQNLRGSGQQFYDTDLLLFLVKSENPNSVMCVFGKGRELDNPKQAFQLHKFSEYPAMGNAVASQNGRGRK